MISRTLAHVSDLHLGRDARTDAAAALVRALLHEGVDDVLVTGDVTHRGRDRELATFERLFAPLADRLVVVPGNHDRAGDDLAARLMPGARVAVERPRRGAPRPRPRAGEEQIALERDRVHA
ncbi:MAG: metallophosphoesterase family protein, partial [Anaeromyxobacteraceae bacterium]